MSLEDLEGTYWAGKCEAQLTLKRSMCGFRCVREKGHSGDHEGKWCAPFETQDGKEILVVDVHW